MALKSLKGDKSGGKGASESMFKNPFVIEKEKTKEYAFIKLIDKHVTLIVLTLNKTSKREKQS